MVKTTTNPTDTEQRWQPPVKNPTAKIKPSKRLTGKQRQFIQALVDNPSQPAYMTAQQAGYSGNPHTLSQVASENLKKPEILAELAKYDNTAQNTVIEVMNYSKELGKSGTTAGASYASTAVQSANSLLDRLHGKATIKTENHTTAVTLSIDLTASVDN